LYFFSFQV